MKLQDQIKAIAELDGWRTVKNDGAAGGFIAISPQGNSSQKLYVSPEQALIQNGQLYMVSRDAIVPVIEKQPIGSEYEFCKQLRNILCRDMNCEGGDIGSIDFVCATPSQLSEALLRATGKWVE